ncbi:hypothetical protein MKW98_014554 [Papaver atlanticum]|uniref:Uncharacterized protein n=1 Tax=Papaver atlanticum TaxID=357466 RepID=A0AAD4SEN7_9MAGN|nr:hypothetical protein MKW98_014554 [Papaver atlanticum]
MSAAAAAAAAAVVTRPSHSSARRSTSSSSYYNDDFNQDSSIYNTQINPFLQTAQTPEGDYYYELYQNTVLKQLRSYEISLGELHNLPATRTVYQRNGNLYYRTSTQKALANEQREHTLAKANLEQHALARANLQPHQGPSWGNSR